MKFIALVTIFSSSFCIAQALNLKNSTDQYLTAYLQDSKTAEVFSVPILTPNGGLAQVDLMGTEGPYTIEWLQLPSPSSDQKTCWGAGTFDALKTSLEAADFHGKGCCSLSGAGKPTEGAGSTAVVTPCDKK